MEKQRKFRNGRSLDYIKKQQVGGVGGGIYESGWGEKTVLPFKCVYIFI